MSALGAELDWGDWHGEHGSSILDVENGGVLLDILGLLTADDLARVDRSLDDVRGALRTVLELAQRPTTEQAEEWESAAKWRGAELMRDAIHGAIEADAERAYITGLPADAVGAAYDIQVEDAFA